MTERVGAELVWAEPATLVVRANVRREQLAPDADLVGSVRINGVVQPPVVYRQGDQLVLLAGHRRTAAAIAVGLDRIQVVVTDPPGGDADRLSLQVSENTNRAGLTVAVLRFIASDASFRVIGRRRCAAAC